MRKFLTTLIASVTAIALAGALAYSAPRFSTSSGCIETANLLSCLNQAVSGAFGVGVSANANVTITPAGSTSGLASVNVTVTAANTAPTIVTINDTGLTGGSMCLATLMGPAPATNAAPVISTVTPGANNLTVVLANPGINTTGAAVLNIGFWCFQ